MQRRPDIATTAPRGYAAELELDRYLRARVEPRLHRLIQLRAPVRNGCALCVDVHGTDMLAAGEDVRRVLAVSTWRESTFFAADERAVLALTDEVTTLGEGGVRDATWAAGHEHLGDEGMADVVLAIGLINLLNRIAVSTHRPARPLANP